MAEFGGVTGGKKVFNRPLGGGQTAGNYVGARRGVNPYDNGANNRAKARGIIRSNRGLPQRPSIRERQEGCDHGCSHGSNVGSVGMNPMGIWSSLGMGAAGSFINPLMYQQPYSQKPGDLTLGLENGVSANSLTGKMRKANSFQDLNNLKKDVETKKNNLASGYSSLKVDTSSLNQDDLQTIEGLIKEKTLPALNYTSLETRQLDSKNLEGCITTIEADIADVNKFKNGLPQINALITSKTGELSGEIAALEAKLGQLPAEDSGRDPLEQQIAEKKEQLTKYNSAKGTLAELSKLCDDNIADLEAKKTEVNDMLKFEEGIKDKEYNLARYQDAQLGKVKAEIAKISDKIDKLSAKNIKSNGKQTDEINELIAQRDGLYAMQSDLISSLSAAPKDIKSNLGSNYEVNSGGSYKIENLSPENEDA